MIHQQRSSIAQLRSQVESLEARGHGYAGSLLLARAILGPATSPQGCQPCREAMPDQIEAELNGYREPGYHSVRRHLDLCSTCSDIYLDLLETALLTEEGPLPRPPLSIDLSFLETPSARRGKNV